MKKCLFHKEVKRMRKYEEDIEIALVVGEEDV